MMLKKRLVTWAVLCFLCLGQFLYTGMPVYASGIFCKHPAEGSCQEPEWEDADDDPGEDMQQILLLETTGRTCFDVTEFGANGSDSEDDWKSIQLALNQAMYAEDEITVTIPEGTYYIKKNLRIFSDTTLVLTDRTTLIASYYGNPMIYGVHLSAPGVLCDYTNCTHGGYSQVNNVTIRGGVWDHNDPDGLGNDSCISFRHASDIHIYDLTVRNCVSHFMNLSGVNHAVVSNVTFENSIAYNGEDASWWGTYDVGDARRFRTIEAVHLDYCNENAECTGRALPCDNTPSQNITVKNCTFRNVFSGVGTHHYAVDGKKAQNIVVKDCYAENMKSAFVYGTDFDNLIIKDNRIAGAASLCQLWRCQAKVYRNYFSDNPDAISSMEAVYAAEDSAVTMKANKLLSSGLEGIAVYDSRLTASDNHVKNSAYAGVYAESSDIRLINNRFSGTGSYAVHVNGGSNAVVRKNITNAVSNGSSACFIENSSACVADNKWKGTISADGIRLLNSNGCKIYRNRIQGFGQYGIRLSSCTSCSVKANTFKGYQKKACRFENSHTCLLRVSAPVLRQVKRTSKGFKVIWSKVNGAAKYQVLRKTKSGKWKTIKVTKTNSYLDTSKTKGIIRRYTVRCLDADGNVISSFNAKGIRP